MKANELRIGNIVYVGGGKHPEVVKYIGERIYIDCSPVIHWDITSIEPIPLTEEWLVKFGFEKEMRATDTGEWKDGISLEPTGGWINTREYEKIIVFPDWVGDQVIIGRTRMKFVHQLQNLFFALTGEELIVK